MKIKISLYSTKDLSDKEKGEKLLNILLTNGFIIEKVGAFEPIRTDFTMDNFSIIWSGSGRNEKTISSCDFLFKGSKCIKFSGMATRNHNLHPNSKALNGVTLWMNIPMRNDFSLLIKLGDDLFEWCEAIYGFISEESICTKTIETGGIQNGISGLMWVNYFGKPYLNEPDFHLPSAHIRVKHGVKVILADTPHDDKIYDKDAVESLKKSIGMEWFWQHSSQGETRVPLYDRSEINRLQ